MRDTFLSVFAADFRPPTISARRSMGLVRLVIILQAIPAVAWCR